MYHEKEAVSMLHITNTASPLAERFGDVCAKRRRRFGHFAHKLPHFVEYQRECSVARRSTLSYCLSRSSLISSSEISEKRLPRINNKQKFIRNSEFFNWIQAE